ncbi:MAG: hypothetical protein LAKADJCE_00760 [Candidatus Argoarchaeum ethanivorans]|uniref:Uncharacterized protein n=1 Tax=Candidatus Argoarchaeum ethanivorans TaxID=2608793 RepID=A0A811TEZ9_9EURY|nr:MAG: hypothetical protein LAKADJCE_00760 [Candidatus Argoarchaeum ethanivorans]
MRFKTKRFLGTAIHQEVVALGLDLEDYSIARNMDLYNLCLMKKVVGALKDVLNKFSDLNSMFSSHDFLIDELNQFYEEIEKETKTPELKERLEEMVKEFNKGKPATYRLTEEPIENTFRFYGEHLINLEYTIERSPNSIEPRIDFWEENQDELLKFRDKPHIVEIHKQLSKKLIQLKELDGELLKKLLEVREEYRKEYNFINNEIEPFRGV